ncbi:MAG: GDSL-type esterase/lipase family protein [Bacteroidota bacterium]
MSRLISSFLSCLVLMSLSACLPNAVKVACVGDSITFGHGLADRNVESYPAQLAALLGDKFEVWNFGVNGRTVLKKGDFPFWNEVAYQESQTFLPEIVLIILGTNDSKPQNWQHRAEFVADYIALVEAYQRLPNQPDVYIGTPPPVYGQGSSISEDRLSELRLGVRAVAQRTGATLVDLNGTCPFEPDYFPDGVHPDALGAKIMAECLAPVVQASSKARK